MRRIKKLVTTWLLLFTVTLFSACTPLLGMISCDGGEGSTSNIRSDTGSQDSSGGSSSNDKTPKKLTVVYPDSQSTLSPSYGSSSKVIFTPKYVSGKVLIGFYGQDSESGPEYFDYKGRVSGMVENSQIPSTVYAVYKDIDYSVQYKSSTQYDEDPHSYYYGLGEGFTFTWEKPIKDSSELAKILYSNPELDVVITTNAMIKQGGDYAVNTTHVIGSQSETFTSKEFASSADSWTAVTLSTTIKGKQICQAENNFWARFVWHGSRSGSKGLVKNLYYTVSLA